MYTLHYAPDNASAIVRLALEHSGCTYRCVLVDRAVSAQKSDDYLALNPNGLIPALETPDGVMFETGAILLWLADRHPDLMPAPDSPARADALKWLFFVSNTLHPAMRMLFYPHKYVDGDTSALLAKTQTNICTHLSVLDEHANPQGLPFAVKAYVACCLRWCAIYGPDDRSWFHLTRTPALMDMVTTLEQEPCVQVLLDAEGLGACPFTNPHRPTPPEGSAL